MRRSKYRRAARSPKRFTGRHRIVAAVATLVAFGGIVTVTQVSDAGTERSTERALAACDRLQAPTSSNLSTETKTGTYTTDNGTVTQPLPAVGPGERRQRRRWRRQRCCDSEQRRSGS